MNPYKIFEAFAGVGGIRLGFEKFGFQTIFVNDFDANCKKTYDSNFTPKLTLQDITKLKDDDIPNFDIFMGGFPCQPFSIAGNKKGMLDERGKLMYTFIDIIKKKKPKILFFENVKNFKTIHNGTPYKFLYEKLEEIGYKLKDAILNTCEYTDIPQNRERIFILGFLDENVYKNFEFPEKNNIKCKSFKDFLEKDIDKKYYYNSSVKIYDKLVDTVTSKDEIYQYRRYYVRQNKNNLVPTLTANMGTGGHNVPIIKDNKGIRKLTPRECFNFQGFPKTYILPQISDSHLYKQAGNSVTVPLIEKIVECLVNALACTNNNILNLIIKKTNVDIIKSLQIANIKDISIYKKNLELKKKVNNIIKKNKNNICDNYQKIKKAKSIIVKTKK